MTAACAALVERGDPDRFLATMAAPAGVRNRLWPLYAYNVEIARAPWASREPMIAEMRLQWWIDALEEIAEGKMPRAHEVVGPLAALIRAEGLEVAPLIAMAEARRWDIWSEPMDTEGLSAHLDATAGNLMWSAAQVLGAGPVTEPVVRDFAFGAGLAAWFRAVPELIARGREPLPPGDPDTLARLAAEGQARMAAARRRRALVPASAGPALRAGWRADAGLRAARAVPGAIATGLPAEPEFRRRGRLLWLSLTGRW